MEGVADDGELSEEKKVFCVLKGKKKRVSLMPARSQRRFHLQSRTRSCKESEEQILYLELNRNPRRIIVT